MQFAIVEPQPARVEALFFGPPMPSQLAISIGQYSDKGRKEINQDFHGALIPEEPLLGLKGIAIVLADGISTSDVSGDRQRIGRQKLPDRLLLHVGFMVRQNVGAARHRRDELLAARADTAKPISLRQGPGLRVHAQRHGHQVDDGAHFPYRRRPHLPRRGRGLEQLTEDHRVIVSSQQSYLGRALGINPQIEIDYRAVTVEKGDLFLLATDGVYEHVSSRFIAETINKGANDLDGAARTIVEEAKRQGSPDNLTVQIVRIDALPDGESSEIVRQASELPCPPLPEAQNGAGRLSDRQGNPRQQPEPHLPGGRQRGRRDGRRQDSVDRPARRPCYLQRFMMEEWVARRINSAHVLKPCIQSRRQNYLYVVTEFVDGQTLTQWMIDNPKPDLETVRGIVEQIAKGLQAFHRLEMLHQDLRPDNIMIDRTGTAKIIDFGSVMIAGITDDAAGMPHEILGTAQYTAPEYFLGEGGSPRSDIFSLGVIAYQMLTGRLPYGRQGRQDTDESPAKKIKIQIRPRRQPRAPGMGRRRAEESRAS